MEFETIAAANPEFVQLLETAGLPVTDLGGNQQRFWGGRTETGELVVAAGLERCGDDMLLRSVVVRGDQRGRGLGGAIVGHVVERAFSDGAGAIFLLTETDPAVEFFLSHGFMRVDRGSVPRQVAATPQFSDICPDSAVAMSLRRV